VTSDQVAELPEHDVAVVVFARTRGVDYLDAANVVSTLLRHTLRDVATRRDGRLPVVEFVARREYTYDVTIVNVTEVGTAAGNGYLWTRPTSRTYRDAGLDPIGEMC
jgi:hypothetical protein